MPKQKPVLQLRSTLTGRDKAQVRHFLGKIHVGTPMQEMYSRLTQLLQDSLRKTSRSRQITGFDGYLKAILKYAADIHRKNLAQYLSVMSGRLNPRRKNIGALDVLSGAAAVKMLMKNPSSQAMLAQGEMVPVGRNPRERKGIKIPTSSRDWQIFTTMKGSGGAARRMTSALIKALNYIDSNFSRTNLKEVLSNAWNKFMAPAMNADRDFGTWDTEPRDTAHQVIINHVKHKLYGEHYKDYYHPEWADYMWNPCGSRRGNPLTPSEAGRLRSFRSEVGKWETQEELAGRGGSPARHFHRGLGHGLDMVAQTFGPKNNPLTQAEADLLRHRERKFISSAQKWGQVGNRASSNYYEGLAHGTRMIRETLRAPGVKFLPNPMRMTPSMFQELRAAILPYMEQMDTRIEQVRASAFPGADVDKLLRWDALFAAQKAGKYHSSDLYRAGLNDHHIDTALMKIQNEARGRRRNPGGFNTEKDFITFLEKTLIPDLLDSGSSSYAETFAEAIAYIREPHRFRRSTSGGGGARNFVQWLRDTLIPDTVEAGMISTARDLKIAATIIEKKIGKAGRMTKNPRMMLLTAADRKRLPKLRGQEKSRDPIAYVKFFTPDSNWTWYATEFDGQDTFFGLVQGFESELGYFSLSELQGVRGPMGLPIERDRYFKPTPLSQVRGMRNPAGNPPAYFVIDPNTNKILMISRAKRTVAGMDAAYWKAAKYAQEQADLHGGRFLVVVHPYIPTGFKKGSTISPMFHHYGSSEFLPKKNIGTKLKRAGLNPRRQNPLLQTVTLAGNPPKKKGKYVYKAVAGSRKRPAGVVGYYPTKEEARKALYRGSRGGGYVERIYVTENLPQVARNFRSARSQRPKEGACQLGQMTQGHCYRTATMKVTTGKGVQILLCRKCADRIGRTLAGPGGTVTPMHSNPSRNVPFREGEKISVERARAWVKSTGDRKLLQQFEAAYKLQCKANREPKYVTWKTIQVGDPHKLESVTAMVEYGKADETMYIPPRGSKKGRHPYVHEWGEGSGKKKPVPLLAAPGGKALIMPLGEGQTAGDWLRG